MSGMWATLFAKKNKWRVNVDISNPTDVRQITHVSRNRETGQLEGLPTAWSKLLDLQTTAAEQNKGKETFKSFLDDEAINEDNAEIEIEIEKILDHKNAQKSQDSDLTIPVEQNENLDEAVQASK